MRCSLEGARHAAHAHGATINDVVLTAVGGGARELLAARSEHVSDLVLRVMVPVSMHGDPAQSAGNQDSTMLVPLALAEPDPLQRLAALAAITAERKARARPVMGTGIFQVAAMQRLFFRFLNHQRSINLSVTNVPGPTSRLRLAGAPILEMLPVASLMGNITLAVAVLSYAGQLAITVMADVDTCPDVATFADGVRRDLSALGVDADDEPGAE